MKVCLIGIGKMGKSIEQQLLLRGHEVTDRLGRNDEKRLESALLESEIAIEFSSPESAVNHLLSCFDCNIPVVCGTTGWLKDWDKVINALNRSQSALIFASNFSVGVQLFFELNRKMAQLMKDHSEYICSLHEIHHTHKKDAPSGTALSLIDDIIENNPAYNTWSLDSNSTAGTIYIHSERIDPVVGMHQVNYNSPIDTIEIRHNAISRDGFAIGAVYAAEYLMGKKGLFTMQDVLGLQSISKMDNP